MKRDEWKQMALIDRMHTLLAGDNARAGDVSRAAWHIEVRDAKRRALEECLLSIFCGHPVTGYEERV